MSTHHFFKTASICILIALAAAPVQAALVGVSFQAQNFAGSLPGVPPQDPITGSFVLQHDSAEDFTGQALNPAIVSVDLAIADYTYSAASTELNPYLVLANGLVSFVQIGGSLNGFGTVQGGTEDFLLVLTNTAYAAPARMRYAVTEILDIFLATNSDEIFDDVTFQSAVVPAPATGWLIAPAIGLLVLRLRRRAAAS